MKKSHLLVCLLPLCLSACGKMAPLEAYVFKLPVFAKKEKARVLQVTDLHWSVGTDFARERAYLDSLIRNSEPDLIVASGDSVMLGSTYVVDGLIRTLDELCEKYDAHFMTSFGNHDRQGTFHPDYWEEAFKKSKRGLYVDPKDSTVYGKSNYVVSLTDGTSDKALWNIFAIDSNTYRQSSHFDIEYDVIHEDQIKWYEMEQEALGKAPNLVYCHIPIYEVEYAFRHAGNAGGTLEEGTGRPLTEKTVGKIGRFSGVMEETDVIRNEKLGLARVSLGYEPTRMFDAIEKNNGKGIFFGHDHVNTFCAEYTLNENNDPEVVVGYGLKTGDGLYYDGKNIGGTLAEITKDGDVEYFRCFQGYEENSFRKEAMFK